MLCAVIRVSAGTAHVLGLKTIKSDASSTTAYLLKGDKCLNNCAFCPQAKDSTDDGSHLSRVVWPEFPTTLVMDRLREASFRGDLQRVCVQFTKSRELARDATELAHELRACTDLPFSVSLNVSDMNTVEELILSGASRVSIALDVASPLLHEKIKGSSYAEKKQLIEECATQFPGRISTHFVVGLGETEEDVIREIDTMYQWGVSVGLFAFTPAKGSMLAKHCPPETGQYRRVQMANYLLKISAVTLSQLWFSEGALSGIDLSRSDLLSLLRDGKAFETAGCPGCNRPYYNERPGATMYNYPRALDTAEIAQCILDTSLGVFEEGGMSL